MKVSRWIWVPPATAAALYALGGSLYLLGGRPAPMSSPAHVAVAVVPDAATVAARVRGSSPVYAGAVQTCDGGASPDEIAGTHGYAHSFSCELRGGRVVWAEWNDGPDGEPDWSTLTVWEHS